MKKLILLLCALLALSAFAPGVGAAFHDITSGPDQVLVESLSSAKIINGFPDGSFMPGGTLTRAQFCKLMVASMPLKDESGRYKSYTVFPDVPHSHWAASYINFAVLGGRFIAGFPNGTFGPDQSITEAQAVTIAIRALGYTGSDIGPLWPRDYITKAGEIGLLDGLDIKADAPMTRIRAARLIYNMLLCDTADGSSFLSANMSSSFVTGEGAIITATHNTDPDLLEGQIRTGDDSIYTLSGDGISSLLIGVRGTLILGSVPADKNVVKGFVPDSLLRETVSLSSVKADRITLSDGRVVNIGPKVPVVIGGKVKPFSSAWVDMRSGSVLTLHYDKGGKLDAIACDIVSSQGWVMVKGSGADALSELYGYFPAAKRGGRIYKNGTIVTAASIAPHDAATYDPAAGAFYLCDHRITGVYQDASPSPGAPYSVKVFNHDFRVLSGDFSSFKVGDEITLVLNPAGSVVGAISPADNRRPQYALFERIDGGGALTFLDSSITVPVDLSTANSDYLGRVVSPYQMRGGNITMSAAANTPPSGDFDLEAMTIGSLKVSPSVAIFEQVNVEAPSVRVDLSDISMPVIRGNRIESVHTDSAGNVTFILLGDVTGNAYRYGFLDIRAESSDGTRAGSATFKNLDASLSLTGRLPQSGSFFAGVVYDASNTVLAFCNLEKSGTVKRDDFNYDKSVKIGGKYVDIAQNAQFYLSATGTFTTLDKLKAFCDTFEIYRRSDDDTVRIIIGK